MSDNQPPLDSALVDLHQDLPDTGRLKRLGLALAVGAAVIVITGIAWR